MAFENKNYAFAGAFVDELARCGVHYVCICPGSRSSPLAISFARHPHIKKWVHLDERSAAFFALGIAKYLKEPVAIVCSSGTATANFFPAIVEARYSSIPLLVLTVDRPPELFEWGALQTIDQTRLYGNHVKWSINMPTPEVSLSLMAFVRSMAGRAIATANEEPAGPVHFNFPFREPLEPVTVTVDQPDNITELQSQAYQGRSEDRPFLRTISAGKMFGSDDVRQLASELAQAERGIIVCGPELDANLASGVIALADRLGYPVLADCLSQVRCGSQDRSMVIDCYDSFIGDVEITQPLAPDIVIRFGALPVSKPLTGYLERCRSARHILIDNAEGWRDPLHLTGETWHIDPSSFCAGLMPALKDERSSRMWFRQWRNLADAAGYVMSAELARLDMMFEGKVFSELAQLLPEESLLFAGNSMPVRDMDTFFPSTGRSIRFMANRGASGIDGVVSTALGASAVSSGRLVLVLGDISFYHDMNGLLAARAFRLNATIIVINNNGGGIFSFLPQADFKDVFEPYFATPHGLTFRAAAELYGLNYHLAEDWLTFAEAINGSLTRKGTTIIEIPGDRDDNVKLHRQIRSAVTSHINAYEGAGDGPNLT